MRLERRLDAVTRARYSPKDRRLVVSHKGFNGRFEFGAEVDLSDAKTRRWLSEVLATAEEQT